MRIGFICVGRIRKSAVGEAAAEYLKRIGRYAPVEVAEVKDEPALPKANRDEVVRAEGSRILGKLKAGDYVVAMADSGRAMTSTEFSSFVEGLMGSGRKRVCFLVGGAFGLHEQVYGRADMTLSLSAMTLPHDLARLLLYEQVYRAFTIIRNEPYSH